MAVSRAPGAAESLLMAVGLNEVVRFLCRVLRESCVVYMVCEMSMGDLNEIVVSLPRVKQA